MIFLKKISRGFTLTELMVNIIIVNAVFITLAFVHYEIEQDFDYETNKNEMINYANHTLDTLTSELSKCVYYNHRANSGTTHNLDIYYNSQDNQSNVLINKSFYINRNFGLFEVLNNGILVPMDNPYNPRDKANRLEHKISFFAIGEPDALVGASFGNPARESSCRIQMEIDLFDNLCDINTDDCNLIETLRFERIVFLPTKYINENKS